MANLLSDREDTAQLWLVRLVGFLIVVLIVGVGGAVVTTTFKNDNELQLLKQLVNVNETQRQEEYAKLTKQLSEVADSLVEVSTNLAVLSGSLYTPEEAKREFDKLRQELKQLEREQIELRIQLKDHEKNT
ncbi:TMhelix containing protein [Vibrio phage vB_ValS_VA-RY-4]|nr:TMhelix containing protein [Vibrio phage vB_VpaS_VP-RY-9]UFD98296.1 TMhelix containing protein [Vibrio phage vB_ValS_VA-RY-4]